MPEFKEDIAQEHTGTIEKMEGIVVDKEKEELTNFLERLERDISEIEGEIDEICSSEEGN